MSQNPENQNPLFKELLGKRKDLDKVLLQASKKISEINFRNKFNNFRSVKKNGVSITRLY